MQSGEGRELTFSELAERISADVEIPDRITTKPADRYTIVGQSVRRPDVANKVFGLPSFVHDLKMSGLLHGRVLRPPSREATLERLDSDVIDALTDTTEVVVEGDFVGVLAEREECCVQAIERLREGAAWRTDPSTGVSRMVYERLLSQPSTDLLVVDGTPTEDAVPPIEDPDGAASTVSATYRRPYQMHGGRSGRLPQWRSSRTTGCRSGCTARGRGRSREPSPRCWDSPRSPSG